jgi:hypothetical protein
MTDTPKPRHDVPPVYPAAFETDEGYRLKAEKRERTLERLRKEWTERLARKRAERLAEELFTRVPVECLAAAAVAVGHKRYGPNGFASWVGVERFIRALNYQELKLLRVLAESPSTIKRANAHKLGGKARRIGGDA